MARLSEMIPGFASALRIPTPSVKNVAAVLRLEKLLTTGPRGPGAPHMGPTDATNLLLALMYDEPPQDAGVTVNRLRGAVLDRCRGIVGYDFGGGTLTDVPGHDFLSENGEPLALGDVLDAILHQQACLGYLGCDDDEAKPLEWLEVVNFSFKCSRPGYSARLWLDTRSVHWTFDYSWHDPDDASRRASELAPEETRFHALADLGSCMTSTREIRDLELQAIGDVLRGFDLIASDQDDCEPPYLARLQAEAPQ